MKSFDALFGKMLKDSIFVFHVTADVLRVGS